MIFRKIDGVFYLWAQKITDILCQGESEEKAEKVKYVVSYVLIEMVKVTTLIAFFWVSNSLKSFFVCVIALVSMRRYMGGFHRKTILGCEIQSVTNFLIIIYMGESINILQLKSIVYIVSIGIICGVVPIMSEERCIYKREKQLEFKVKALIVLVILIISIQFLPRLYANCILWTMLFQDAEDIFKWISQERSRYERKNKGKP